MSFYTNVFTKGKKVYLRQVNDHGVHERAVLDYRPYLFVQTPKADDNTKYRTVRGKPVKRIDFEDIYEARNYIKQYSELDGFNMFGFTDFTYTYIYDNYGGEIKYDTSKINRVSVDIETDSEDGYPNIELADKEITMITLGIRGVYHAISLKDYVPHKDNVRFYRAKDEYDLMRIFLSLIETFDPDLYTGWNIEFFDIPYLYRRIRKMLGEGEAKRMSPWGIVEERTIKGKFGKDETIFNLCGVSVVDYLALYKKFTFTTRDNYKLDTIAQVELGLGKVDYSEYGSLHGLWEKNPQLFAEYNIRDTEIVDQLEEKMKLLELLFAITYDAKINFIDCFTTVRGWDVMIHNHLMDQNIVVPFQKGMPLKEDFGGGYVKEPQINKFKWVASFDLNSLYPSLIQHYNISPEKFMGMGEFRIDEFSLLDEVPEDLTRFMKQNNVTVTPNRAIWSRDGQGFLAEMMAMKYAERKSYKKEMLRYKKLYEETKSKEYADLSLQMDMKQMAKKIQLNSAYGALGNIYFRWYLLESAAAITSGGRLTTRWTEKKLNEWLNKAMKTVGVDYVIYADTDSVYLNLEPIVNSKFGDKLAETSDKEITDFLDMFGQKAVEPYLDKIYDELTSRMNAFENHMKMKREAIASSGIFVSAKMYALSVLDNEGVRFAEPKLKVTGLDAVRSTTPAAFRESLKTAMKILLNGTRDEYHDYVAKFEEEFKLLPFDQIATNSGVNGLGKYANPVTVFEKGTPYHVKAVLQFNDFVKKHGYSKSVEEIREGDKVGMMPLRAGNPIGADRLALKDSLPIELFYLYDYIDYGLQFEKGFLNPLSRITKILGYAPKRVPTLESVFFFED